MHTGLTSQKGTPLTTVNKAEKMLRHSLRECVGIFFFIYENYGKQAGHIDAYRDDFMHVTAEAQDRNYPSKTLL